YKVGCDLPGKYRVALDSDAWEFGGHGRVGHDVDHFTSPEGIPGVPETNFNGRPNSFKVLSPPRTCVVYYKVEEDLDDSYGEDFADILDPVTGAVALEESLDESVSNKKDVGPSTPDDDVGFEMGDDSDD
ncbi:Starch branching enzyme i, partial [Thalictrum thalictroides]